MSEDFPQVSVWTPSGSQWAKVGDLATYDSIKFQPEWLAVGSWSMSMPYDLQATSLLRNRLVTIDWRGVRTTWCIETFEPSSETDSGMPILSVGGPSAYSFLARALAWPNPTGTLTTQPRDKVYTGPTETVLRAIIDDNLRARYGLALTVPASGGRGPAITARCRFENILELVTEKAKAANLGVDVGLVNAGSSTRANLTLRFWTPQDKSKRVRLSQRIGTLSEWKQSGSAPTATSALVGGAGTDTDRVFRQVTTPASITAASTWGGHREIFVDGPQSYDAPELDQAGTEELTSGASTETLTLTSAEAEGLMAFRDYQVGDKAYGEVLEGESVTDVITAIGVEISSNGFDITPTFGDPNAAVPLLSLASIISQLRSDVRSLQTRR